MYEKRIIDIMNWIKNAWRKGYITIDIEYRVNVSKRLFDDFGNGKDYSKHDGERMLILPQKHRSTIKRIADVTQ